MAPEPEAQPAAVAHAIASAQLQNVFEIVADLRA
jgi:hypothetical protein